jgi:hypothetical protein
MIYYPKSHITPNLYSNGELAYKDTLAPYTGQYFSTFDNKFFTGNYPGDSSNLELVNLNSAPSFPTPELFEDSNPEDSRFYPENQEYSTLKKVQYNQGIITTPIQFYPSPSIEDYETGEFIRYFSKKSNEEVYYETNSFFKNKLYIGFSLPWKLTGSKDQVFKVNKGIVELKQQQFKAFGLGAYLKFNYIQYYK